MKIQHNKSAALLKLLFLALWFTPAHANNLCEFLSPYFLPAGSPVLLSSQINSFELALETSSGVADVYYPDVGGVADCKSSQYPVVVMLQGANATRQVYSQFAAGVAQYGFVVVVPNNISSVFNGASGFSDIYLISEVLEELQEEELDPVSPVYGIVDTSRLGLSGHSFGGAGALFAVADECTFPWCDADIGWERPPELMAAALVAANSGAFDLDTSGTPIAILAGSDDSSFSDYEASYSTLEAPKAFIVVNGANHFSVFDAVDADTVLARGEPLQTVPHAITVNRFARYAGNFLRTHMHQDWASWWFIYGNPWWLVEDTISGDDGVDVIDADYPFE